MRLFKRGKYWYIEFNKYKKKSLKTTNKKEAERIFKHIQQEIHLKKFINLADTVTLSDLIKEYLEYVELKLSWSTLRIVKDSFKYLLEIVPSETPLKAITPKKLEELIAMLLSRGWKPVSINIHIRHLKAAFNKAIEWDYLEKNPFAKIKQLKVEKKQPRFLTKEDIEKVRDIIEDELWRNMFDFFIYTGGRRSEILNLTWQDITDEYVIFRKTKNRKERKVPIPEQLKEVINKMRGENKKTTKIGRIFPSYDKDYVTRRFKKYFKKAGFPEMRLHDLRHTYASLLIMNGVDIYTIRELLGHSGISVTQIYAHLNDTHLKNAVKKIDF